MLDFLFGKKEKKEGVEETKAEEKGLLKNITFHVMPSIEGAASLGLSKPNGLEGTVDKKAVNKEEKQERPSLAPPPKSKSPPPLPMSQKLIIKPPPVLAKKPPLPHGASKISLKSHSKWSTVAIIAGLLFAIAAGVGGWYWYSVYRAPFEGERGTAKISAGRGGEIGTEDDVAGIAGQTTRETIAPTTEHFLADRGLVSAADIDADLLTDLEEELFGCDSGLPDSDYDGWPDGWELVHLYDPAAGNAQRLIENPKMTGFQNESYGYAVLHPNQWIVQAVDKRDAKDIVITSATGEFIQITSIALDEAAKTLVETQGLERWVRNEYPGGSLYTLHPFTNKFEVDGLQSSDSLTAFLKGEGIVYMVRYMPGLRQEINFKRTLSMIVAGFLIEEGVPPALVSEPVFVTPEVATTTPESSISATSTEE